METNLLGATINKSSITLRLSRFVITRRTENLRKELQEGVVILAIYASERSDLSKDEIISSIKKHLRIKKFPRHILESVLNSLMESNKIERIFARGIERYFLSDTTITKIDVMTREYDNLYSSALGKLYSLAEREIGRPLSKTKKSQISKALHTFLSEILTFEGLECATAILGNRKGVKDVIATVTVHDHLDEALNKIKVSKRMKRILKRILFEFLLSMDEDMQDLLYSLAQSCYLLELLHLDPECQHLTKESLKQKFLYLDTNLIVRYLLKTNGNEPNIKKLLSFIRAAGNRLIISQRTCTEYLNLLKSHEDRLKTKTHLPPKRYEKLKPIMRNDFLKGFQERKKNNPSLTWEGYFGRLREFEMLMEDLIEIDEEEYDNIDAQPMMERAKKLVQSCWPGSLPKSKAVVQHDAYHIVLMQELRQTHPTDLLGPNCWFLTLDHSLACVDKQLWEQYQPPSSISPDMWLQIISPLIPPEIPDKELTEVFASLLSTRFPALTTTVRDEDLLDLQGTWMDSEDLGPDEIARIIGNTYVRSFLDGARQEGRIIEPEEFDRFMTEHLDQIRAEIAAEMDEEREVDIRKGILLLIFGITICILADFIVWQRFSMLGLTIVFAIEGIIGSIFAGDIRELIREFLL